MIRLFHLYHWHKFSKGQVCLHVILCRCLLAACGDITSRQVQYISDPANVLLHIYSVAEQVCLRKSAANGA